MKLDATPLGRPLYERLGFSAEWPLTRWETGSLHLTHASTEDLLTDWTEGDLTQTLTLDQEAFGCSRQNLLSELARQALSTTVHRDSSTSLAGYGMLRAGSRACYLGPVVARSPQVAGSLVHGLLARTLGRPVFWDIPDRNESATELAQVLGFTVQRHLLRMFRGENTCVGNLELQYAIADPAVG